MSQATVRLVPLTCIKCQAPVPAQPDEIAWVCATCGQGLLLNETPAAGQAALRGLDVFFSKAIAPGGTGSPFWVARGQVTLTNRQTYTGDEGRAARDFWAAPRLFFIPAWDLPLEDLMKTGADLLKAPRRMDPGSPTAMRPVVTPLADIRALAEFLVVSIEADRKDYLKTIKFDLKLEPAQLWVM